MGTVIEFQDVLHGFWAGSGTENAYIEDNLNKELYSIR